MSALTISGEDSFIFSFVTYRLMTKSLGVGCTFKVVVLETKCRKMNVNPRTSQGQNPLKLPYSIMIEKKIQTTWNNFNVETQIEVEEIMKTKKLRGG